MSDIADSQPAGVSGVHQLHYIVDSTLYFERLSTEVGAVFLDSGRPTSTVGRYDIMSAWPEQIFQPEINESADCYFARIRKALSSMVPAHPPESFSSPFTGGLLGFLGYDFSRRFDLPVVSKATDHKTPIARIGIYCWALITDHELKQTFLIFHPSCTKNVRQASIDICSAINQLEQENKFTLNQHFVPNCARDKYRDDIKRIQQYILAGDCYQVNYAQRFESRYCGDPWDAYKRIRSVCPTPYSAFLSLPEGAISSHSPERFLSITDRKVETRPIKGTRRRSADVDEDAGLAAELSVSPKDRAENVMIVDLLRNDIGRVCVTGSVKVTELFTVESYPNVHHLVSAISGLLSHESDAFDLLAACFPGGSITGAPKIRAMQIIDELESHSRSVYCGSIFYLDCRGQMDSSISIRTMLFDCGDVFCWGGGGIISDSEWEDEYIEVANKVNVLMQALEETLL